MARKNYAQQITIGLIWMSYNLAFTQPDMVQVEGGAFLMGCYDEQDPDCQTVEFPVHEVTVSEFSLSQYEITQGEWNRVTGNNPSTFSDCGETCPVESVNWFEAVIFCNQLSEQQGIKPCYYRDAEFTQIFGKSGSDWDYTQTGAVYWFVQYDGYRLPTEAEWEFAARGGVQSLGYKYAGSHNSQEVAWWDTTNDNSLETQPVGGKLPNELGLYDMSGHVAEHCWDWYQADYYESSPDCNPMGPTSGTWRVSRGGGWNGLEILSRTTHRNFLSPTDQHFFAGLRVARGVLFPEDCSSIGLKVPEMVAVSGGVFDMGCTPEQEEDCNGEEIPVHQVAVSDFNIGALEVSQKEWQRLFGDHPSFFDGCGVDCPVEQVSWFQAIIYCNRLSEASDLTPCYYVDPDFSLVFGKAGDFWQPNKEGEVFWDLTADGFRLPTEAEWEFAARGGNLSQDFTYAGSNSIEEVAWYANNSGNTSREGGVKNPNELGLYDMSGNVWEWCWDWFSSTYYERSPFCNPLGSTPNEVKSRRGGAWVFNANGSRVSNRDGFAPEDAGSHTGFRLARGAVDTTNCRCTFTFSNEVESSNCIAPNEGQITLVPDSGGEATDYQYQWFNNEQRNDGNGLLVSNLVAGNYQITLTDVRTGCEATGQVNIPMEENIPIFSECAAFEDVGTKGGADGIGLITISEGAAPFQIQWNGPVTGTLSNGQRGGNRINNLQAGSYDIEITDANGCINTCNVIIEEPDCSFQASAVAKIPSCYEGNDGSITLEVNNGIGPYRYEWENDSDSGSGEGLTIADLSAANYQITITDTGNGCTQIVSLELEEGTSVALTCAETMPSSGMGLSDGAATIEILSGVGPFSISWVGPSSGSLVSIERGSHMIENLMDGTYTVSLVDANGCMISCSLSIMAIMIEPCLENPVPLPIPKEALIQICEGDVIPALEVVPQENLTYNWYLQDGTIIQNNTNTLVVEQPGSYFVEAIRTTDSCRSVDRLPIRVVSGPLATISIDQIQCIGEDQAAYMAQLSISNAVSVSANVDLFSKEGQVHYYADIPIDEPLEIVVEHTSGCMSQRTIMPPNCNCPTISAPTIENASLLYCPSGEMPVLTATVVAARSIRWYTQPLGGEVIGEGASWLPPAQGQYYAEAYDPDSGCVSAERTMALYFPLAEPTIRDLAKFCDPDLPTYSVLVAINNGTNIETTMGQIVPEGENQFSIIGIPLENEIVITATSEFSGCISSFTTNAPICTCQDLSAPTLVTPTTEGAAVVYCSNGPKPTLIAQSPLGTSVNWYDAPQQGHLLAASTHRFSPNGPGNYYMETIDPNGTCTSQERVGVRVDEVFQPFSIEQVMVCNIDSIVSPDTVAFAGTLGCDSLAITVYRFAGEIQEFLDTQIVCSPLDTGTAIRYEAFEGCTARYITERVLGDFSETSLVVFDTIDNCMQMEMVDISAQVPSVGFGQWLSLDGADEDIQDPMNPQTAVRLFRPGWNRFVWTLSNDDCMDYASDTVYIWNPMAISTQDVVFEQIVPGASILEADLLFNDTFLVGESRFLPLNHEGIPNLAFQFNEQASAYTGRFSYLSSQPTIVQFNYELCDNRCLHVGPLCDTSTVRIVVCDQSGSQITFKNGFDPYLDEWFDPVGNLQAISCDFGVDPAQIAFRVYDKQGHTIYAPDHYAPWNGRRENNTSKTIVGIDLYFWSLAINIDQGEAQQTLRYTGSVLVYHGD